MTAKIKRRQHVIFIEHSKQEECIVSIGHEQWTVTLDSKQRTLEVRQHFISRYRKNYEYRKSFMDVNFFYLGYQ